MSNGEASLGNLPAFCAKSSLQQSGRRCVGFFLKGLRLRKIKIEPLLASIQPDGALEKEFNLNACPRTLPGELQEALGKHRYAFVANPGKDCLFGTLWTIIDKNRRVLVGDLCFKGSPNESGETEIGSGTHPAFQHQGYMTEEQRAHWYKMGVVATRRDHGAGRNRTGQQGFAQHPAEK